MTKADVPEGVADTTWKHTPTRTIKAGGVEFAYRELGPRGGVPLVFLHHLTAVLDDWDPRVIDGIAARRHVITFDNRGVGASSGSVPHTIDEMAADAVAFIRGLGHDQVDLLGFSLGGGVAQVIALEHPDLPHDLGRIRQPVLVANGDNDVMVASEHSADMARRLPDAKLVIYPDSGHGGVFQYHQQFVPEVLEFLER
jgi:pimeloyl-ACP methyl ester carboxylesterase